MKILFIPKPFLSTFAVCALGLAAMPAAHAASPHDIEQKTTTQLHETNLKEIGLADLAQAKSNTASVKEYSTNLKRDHEAADRSLLDLARTQKLDIKEPKPVAQSSEYKKLNDLSASEFDKEYLKTMEKGHKEALEMVTKARDELPADSVYREFLASLVPKLEHHQEVAVQLQKGEKPALAR